MTQPQAETRICNMSGCTRPAAPAEAGAGRPPEYCTDPGHNRVAAYRVRRSASAQATGQAEADDLGRPVAMAGARAGVLAEQTTQQLQQAVQSLTTLLAEYRTLGDLDAAAAQIETVTTEADQRVAEAAARAARAEQARRDVTQERVEADAAAEDAINQVDRLNVNLEDARTALSDLQAAQETEQLAHAEETERLHAQLSAAVSRLAEEAVRAEAAEADAQALRVAVQAEQNALQLVRAELEAARRATGAATQQARDAEITKDRLASDLDAERTRSAEATAAAAAAQAETNALTSENARLKRDLEQARARAEAEATTSGTLRADVATLTAQLAAAEQRVSDERAHTEARLTDQRTAHEERLAELRDRVDTATKSASTPRRGR